MPLVDGAGKVSGRRAIDERRGDRAELEVHIEAGLRIRARFCNRGAFQHALDLRGGIGGEPRQQRADFGLEDSIRGPRQPDREGAARGPGRCLCSGDLARGVERDEPSIDESTVKIRSLCRFRQSRGR